jgi:hypothetical protein
MSLDSTKQVLDVFEERDRGCDVQLVSDHAILESYNGKEGAVEEEIDKRFRTRTLYDNVRTIKHEA